MSRAILFVIALIMPLPVCAGDEEKYIGLVYPPELPGLIEKGGGLAKGDASSHGLWYLSVEVNGRSMIWLTREIGRLRETPKDSWPVDRPIWRVEDVLPTPALHHGETILLGNDIECSFKGEADTSIIAVGQWSWRKEGVGGYAHHMRSAWRIEPMIGRFEAIPSHHVRCELNEDRD